MKTSQLSLFDEEKRYAKLTELGDPLEKLDNIMDWEMFREKLTKACQKEDYAKGGCPPIDVITKFKALFCAGYIIFHSARLNIR